MAEVSRLFVAAPLTGEARHALAALLRDRVPDGLPGRPVPPPNWHLTLRFLGDVDEVGSDRLAAGLDRADLGAPFTIVWGGLGAFPRPARATVLWIGTAQGGPALAALAAAVEEAVQSAGFPSEERPFRGHLTLSRIRPDRDVRSLLAAVPPAGIAMQVERVVLYRSHLGPGGARYEQVEEFPLG